ncbi:RNA chaperone ProQ [secondary endosymbiont of Ctenarytaina eucalypti]|uniref:RNA chaperone ProQ n=1 Tax=secondary endosymbiont of Ctenarytaina eucalypti TaxID=1199245 RepID=J3TG23_9ENTR|nr:RNA chaperone ProQ [secondary endosymbiont of Ctenarytaina eucalypti]AFP85302.1 activator of osmoprotectant transporter ProP [secondary endosymbiont of Ctenarytaina eucalypti]
MNNKTKLKSKKEVIKFLANRFPLCFTTQGKAKPLKIGIFQDLVEQVQGEENISKTQLRSALHRYVSTWRYLNEIKIGVQRIDLAGNPCGAMETQHVEHARKTLTDAKARVQLQLAAEEPKTRINDNAATLHGADLFNQARKSKPETTCIPHLKKANPSVSVRQTTRAVKTLAVTSLDSFRVGQTIKVKIGKNPIQAIILNIGKAGVHIQLSSGMAVIIREEDLQLLS